MNAEFAPLPAALGGALIGISASMMLLGEGRVAGITGILDGFLRPKAQDWSWRAAFIAGLLLAGGLAALIWPAAFSSTLQRPPAILAVAGLLVGFGTRLGNGCTSGHGVCGLSRLSARSLVAVMTFMGAAGLTVFLLKQLGIA